MDAELCGSVRCWALVFRWEALKLVGQEVPATGVVEKEWKHRKHNSEQSRKAAGFPKGQNANTSCGVQHTGEQKDRPDSVHGCRKYAIGEKEHEH